MELAKINLIGISFRLFCSANEIVLRLSSVVRSSAIDAVAAVLAQIDDNPIAKPALCVKIK